jgi:hypothetical protein
LQDLYTGNKSRGKGLFFCINGISEVTNEWIENDFSAYYTYAYPYRHGKYDGRPNRNDLCFYFRLKIKHLKLGEKRDQSGKEH